MWVISTQAMESTEGRCQSYGRSRRLTFLQSLFAKEEFLLGDPRSYRRRTSLDLPDFDHNELQYEFSRVCDDFFDPIDEASSSASLGFCYKMLYEFNPFFRENRTRQIAHVLEFPSDKPIKKVIVVPYNSSVKHKKELGTCVERDGQIMLKITPTQGILLAMHVYRKLIDLYPDNIFLMPQARAAFVNMGRIPNLADELNMTVPEVVKMINASCVNGAGHYLKEADPSCALVSYLFSTNNINDKERRLSVMEKLIQPYLDQGREPVLEKAIIFEKYATPE